MSDAEPDREPGREPGRGDYKIGNKIQFDCEYIKEESGDLVRQISNYGYEPIMPNDYETWIIKEILPESPIVKEFCHDSIYKADTCLYLEPDSSVLNKEHNSVFWYLNINTKTINQFEDNKPLYKIKNIYG